MKFTVRNIKKFIFGHYVPRSTRAQKLKSYYGNSEYRSNLGIIFLHEKLWSFSKIFFQSGYYLAWWYVKFIPAHISWVCKIQHHLFYTKTELIYIALKLYENTHNFRLYFLCTRVNFYHIILDHHIAHEILKNTT